MAHRLYFTEVAQKGESVRFTLYEKARIDVTKIPELVAAYGQKVTFTADPKNPYFTYHPKRIRGTRMWTSNRWWSSS